MSREGYYMYGIIATSERREFGPIGMGGRGDSVYTLPYQELAAVVSASPLAKYQVSRANAMAHMKVLEKVMEDYSLLPVRFCTIAEEEEAIIEDVLKARYEELVALLRGMDGKIELGVRVRWTDINAVFAEVAEENQEIKAMREEMLNESNEQIKYAQKIKIGQMVKEALDEKKKREAEEVLAALQPLSINCKENSIAADVELVNAAFLVDRKREGEFDHKIQELERVYGERKRIKYVGPVAPYNFVEVVVS